jgi:hypothetical protein
MSETDRIIEELQAVKFLLTLSNNEKIDEYINKVITTTVRKKMWTLIDGSRMPTDISKDAGVTSMAVSYFLSSVVNAGLIKYEKGTPPRRIINYTPPDWAKEIEEFEAKEQKSKETETKF